MTSPVDTSGAPIAILNSTQISGAWWLALCATVAVSALAVAAIMHLVLARRDARRFVTRDELASALEAMGAHTTETITTAISGMSQKITGGIRPLIAALDAATLRHNKTVEDLAALMARLDRAEHAIRDANEQAQEAKQQLGEAHLALDRAVPTSGSRM